MRKETVYRIFSHIPTLETPRLTLRGMRVSDAEDVFDYASREGGDAIPALVPAPGH
ncbi:MAG: hypothetical protein L6V84_06595 [Oscillospiraceae bacterium]|nr:MAG: hypothetical protein L6V84_06595 [Oscillospiraceae bacterium]